VLCSCNIFSGYDPRLSHPSGLLDVVATPSRRAPEGSPKSEYPGEARLGTLPNSYFTTARTHGFSHPPAYAGHIPSTKRYSIRSRRFFIERSLSLSLSLSFSRFRLAERGEEVALVSSSSSSPTRSVRRLFAPSPSSLASPVFAEGFTMFAVRTDPYCYL